MNQHKNIPAQPIKAKLTFLSSLCLMTLLTLCPLWTKAQNHDITGTVRAESGEPMPFAAIAVFSGSDTTRILKSSVTDQAGEYVVRDVGVGDYRIAASSLGFEVSQKDITVGTENVNVDFVMAESAVAMDGVTVRGKRTIDFADRSVYTFSDAQVKKARQLADLVATVRDLDTDPQTGRIVRKGGGALKLLLNGLNATESDLKNIPAEKILKVEYYTIPPARYAAEGTVVNIITKRLDTGFAIGGDATHAFTTGFGNDNVYVRRTAGRHQMTADYSLSYRNYDDNHATQSYRFSTGGKEQRYIYSSDLPFAYTLHNFNLKYLYSKPQDITVQTVVSPSFTHDSRNSHSIIMSDGTGGPSDGHGKEYSRTNTFGTSADLYLNKRIDERNELTANVVYTYYHNNQQHDNRQWAGSSEDNMFLDDNMLLTNDKHSVIGEAIYTRSGTRNSLNVGYKGTVGSSQSAISNHLTSNRRYDYHSSNSSHYAYVDWGGTRGKFGYRLSAGATYVHTDNDDTSYHDWVFSPAASLSYSMKRSSIQIQLTSQPVIPAISQLSNNSEQVIPGLIKQGNPYLKSGNSYSLYAYYSHHRKWMDLTAGFFGNYVDNAINTYYKYGEVNGEVCIVSTNENARSYRQSGGFCSMTVKPLGNETLTLRAGGNAIRQKIDSDLAGNHAHWYTPLWYTVNLSLGRFGASYMGSVVSKYISGPLLVSDENSGHLQLYYQHRQVRITAGCLFLFTKSKYSSEILNNNVISYSSNNSIDDNKSMFILGLSWNLFKGKSIDANKKMDNRDTDKGTF